MLTEEELDKYVNMFPEFLHVFKVLEKGREKHGGNGDNWLAPNAAKMDHRSNCESRFHHLAEEFVHPGHRDLETGLPVTLHEACRALMQYTLNCRGIKHEKDL